MTKTNDLILIDWIDCSAWIPYRNCWVLSKDYPGGEKKKSNIHFDRSLAELQDHIEQLRKLYGCFNYAPVQTLLSEIKPFKFVPVIDGREC